MATFHIADLQKILSHNFSEALEIATLEAIDISYQQTREHLTLPYFDRGASRDLRGHYLRSRVETNWRNLLQGLSGATTGIQQNSQKTYYHTWVRSGRLLLTASAVSDKFKNPRIALFRKTYAWDGQLDLLNPEKNIINNSGGYIYGLLRYGPSKALFPKFVNISFPDANSGKYITILDLLKKHPGSINLGNLAEEEYQEEPIPEIAALPEEEIQEPQSPTFRPRPKRVGEEEL